MIDHCSLVFSSLVYSLIGCFKLLKLLWFSNYLPEVNFTYSLHTVLVSYEKRHNLNGTMQNRGTPLVCSDLFIFWEILETQVASWDQPGTSVCSKTPEHKIWKEEPWHYRGLKHMVVDGVLFLASSTYKYTDTHTQMDNKVSASRYPNVDIRHSSLSETAARYLISRSGLRLSLTARVLAHPWIFLASCHITSDSFAQEATISHFWHNPVPTGTKTPACCTATCISFPMSEFHTYQTLAAMLSFLCSHQMSLTQRGEWLDSTSLE